jgi:hypothetical protein
LILGCVLAPVNQSPMTRRQKIKKLRVSPCYGT